MNRLADQYNASVPASARVGPDAGVSVIVADDVAEHHFAIGPREYHDVRDYRGCLPPFARCILE
jgi:hypothetical protein